MPTHNLAQHKSQVVVIVSGLIVLLAIGLGLFRENPTTLANPAATATALTAGQATWRAIAKDEPDKATQEAILDLTRAVLPTDTPFDKMATDAALNQMLTTSPTPGPTILPMPYLQRSAGVGRLFVPQVITCGYYLKCRAENFWMEKTKDKFIVVYAGSRFNDNTNSLEALVYVEWHPLNERESFPTGGGTFFAPTSAQDVMIVDVIGEQLTLRTDEGTLLVFDVPSLQYVAVPPAQLTSRLQRPVTGGTVIENSDAPFTLPGFSANNRWSGKNAKGRITVFVGGSNKKFKLGTGMLALVASKGEPTAADVPQVYSLPESVYGALRLFDVKGNWVALTDQGGGEYFFDLAARQFFSPFDERAEVFTAQVFDENMPIANATSQPVTPFIPPAPISTPVSNAYP